MPAPKPTNLTPLSARDFAYVYQPGIGAAYQKGPYVILADRGFYAATYRGETFSLDLGLQESIEACTRHKARRN
jgi:hypothetical protein